MKIGIRCFALALLASQCAFSATVAISNVNSGGDAAYGVRDSSGVLVSGTNYKGVMGFFTVSDAAVTSAFAAGNTAAISSAFSAFDPTSGSFALDTLAPGVFDASESFDTKASANAFGGSSIYTVLFKGADIATATELLIAKLTTAFPTDPEVGLPLLASASFTPSGISSVLVGTSGGTAHDYGLGGGALPTYGLSSVPALVPEPSRVLFLALGCMGFLMRRRRA